MDHTESERKEQEKFLKSLPTFDIAPYAIGMAKDGELKEMYSDWEILQFLSYTFEEEHEGVPLHKHSSNKLVARKIR